MKPFINDAFVDRYTVAHGASGVLMAFARLPWWTTLGLAIGWEIIEHPLKDAFPKAFPYSSQDSLANSTGDVIGVMLGWGLAKLLGAGT